MTACRSRSSRRARGYALLAAVVATALVALATLVPLQNARHAAQREREKELLFAGQQIAAAIARYYDGSPGAKQYPNTLDDLLEDRRFPQVRRYLRRLYRDPMTPDGVWAIDRVQGRIVAVHSRSVEAPLRRARFPRGLEAFADAHTYAQWRFGAVSVVPASTADSTSPDPSPTQPPLDVAARCVQLYLDPLEQQCGPFLPASPREYRACAAALSTQFQQCLAQGRGG